jgi:hypothetical protein
LIRASSSRGLERGHLVLLLGARREQHDGDVLGALVGTQAPREGQPRHAGQHPVEQYQIGSRVAHQCLGLRHVARAHHLVAGTLQVRGKQVARRDFVFDYQNGTGHDCFSFV